MPTVADGSAGPAAMGAAGKSHCPPWTVRFKMAHPTKCVSARLSCHRPSPKWLPVSLARSGANDSRQVTCHGLQCVQRICPLQRLPALSFCPAIGPLSHSPGTVIVEGRRSQPVSNSTIRVTCAEWALPVSIGCTRCLPKLVPQQVTAVNKNMGIRQ